MQHAGRYLFLLSPSGFRTLTILIIGGLKAIGITPYIGFFISGIFFTVWSWFWYKILGFSGKGGKI